MTTEKPGAKADVAGDRPEAPNAGEREFETGKDEAWFANIKRTYDEYQDLALTAARRSQDAYDTLISRAQTHFDDIAAITKQHMQNAVSNANEVAKQSLRHESLATDRQWNVDEQGYTVDNILEDETFQQGIAAAVTNAVVAALSKKD